MSETRVEIPRVIAKMSVQRVLENALRFAEDVPDNALSSAEVDRRETVIDDLKVLLANVRFV